MAKKLQLVPSDPPASPTPPRPLGKHGLALWRSIHSEYQLEDGGSLEMLAQACASVDRAEGCAAAIARDGVVIVAKGCMREHPLLKCELSNRAFATRTLARLGLVYEAIKPVGRPPGQTWSG